MKKLFKIWMYNVKKAVFMFTHHLKWEVAGEAMIMSKFIKKKEESLKVKEKNGYVTLYHFSPKLFKKFDHKFFRTGQGGSVTYDHFFGGNKQSALNWKAHMQVIEGYLYTVQVPIKFANKDWVIDEFTYWYIEYTVAHENETYIKIKKIEKIKNEEY